IVTGVQTCALPILISGKLPRSLVLLQHVGDRERDFRALNILDHERIGSRRQAGNDEGSSVGRVEKSANEFRSLVVSRTGRRQQIFRADGGLATSNFVFVSLHRAGNALKTAGDGWN